MITFPSLLDLVDIVDVEADDDEAPQIYKDSHYYDDNTLIDILNKKQDIFTILSLNCQSLQAKFDILNLYLQNLKMSNGLFSAICIQETWLNSHHDISMFSIDGYQLVAKPSSSSVHGGVGIYINDNFKFKVLDIEYKKETWDGIFIEVSAICANETSLNTRKIILGNIYRPPRNTIEDYKIFLDDLNHILNIFQTSRAEVIISGDYNIDLLKMHEKPIFSEYFDTITSNGYITKITFPTRITDTTQTLIDNIPVKMSHNYSETTAGILTHQISDHMPYFITLDYIKCSTKSAKYLKVFNKNLQSLNAFKIEIGNLNLPTKLHQNLDTDPNLNYKIVSDYISCAFEKHLPIEILKFKKYKHKKNKWITQGIIKS